MLSLPGLRLSSCSSRSRWRTTSSLWTRCRTPDGVPHTLTHWSDVVATALDAGPVSDSKRFWRNLAQRPFRVPRSVDSNRRRDRRARLRHIEPIERAFWGATAGCSWPETAPSPATAASAHCQWRRPDASSTSSRDARPGSQNAASDTCSSSFQTSTRSTQNISRSDLPGTPPDPAAWTNCWRGCHGEASSPWTCATDLLAAKQSEQNLLPARCPLEPGRRLRGLPGPGKTNTPVVSRTGGHSREASSRPASGPPTATSRACLACSASP